ncbi:MAG: DRTGG domain-containing protein [Bacillota bacterium]
MTVGEICKQLGLTLCTNVGAERQVTGGYCSDLLSDVLANAKPGDLWLTIQTHINVVAVASLIGVAGVIMTSGRRPEQATVEKAEKEGVPLILSGESSFETAGKLYRLLRGDRNEVLRG